MRFFLYALAFFCLAAPGTARAQPACSRFPPPQVTVHVEVAPISYDFTKSADYLTRLSASRGVHTDVFGSRTTVITRGLHDSQTGMESSMQAEIKRLGAVAFCGDLVTIDVALRVIKNVILVARDYADGGCTQQAILGHEQKHVATLVGALNEYQPIFQKSILAASDTIGPYLGRSQAEVSQVLKSRLGAVIHDLMQRMNDDITRRQAMIDTRQEYDRVAAQCPN